MIGGFFSKINKGQLFFLLTGSFFLFFLVGSVFARSLGRSSVIASGSPSSNETLSEEKSVSETKSSSSLQLQDFHRVQVKDGRVLWEVKARDAKYLLSEGVTHVNDSLLMFYRTDGTKIRISSKAARLYSDKMGVSKAELEGSVSVEIGDQVRVSGELAQYNTNTNTVVLPDDVSISGEGYIIEGKDLLIEIEEQLLTLERSVSSTFDPAARSNSAKSTKNVMSGVFPK